MTVDMSVFERILQKDELVRQLRDAGFTQERIDAEWDRILQVFTFLYLQSAYESLPGNVQTEIIEGMNEEPTEEEVKLFCSKMVTYIEENPEAVDAKVAVEQAVEEMVKVYEQYTQEKEI